MYKWREREREKTTKAELLIIAHINSLTLLLCAVRMCAKYITLFCGYFKVVSMFPLPSSPRWCSQRCTPLYRSHFKWGRESPEQQQQHQQRHRCIECVSIAHRSSSYFRKNHLTFQRIPINLIHSKPLYSWHAHRWLCVQNMCYCTDSAMCIHTAAQRTAEQNRNEYVV